LSLLKTTHSDSVKIGVLNFLWNLAFPTEYQHPHERGSPSAPRQRLLEMNLVETVLQPMKERERDKEVRKFIQRCISKLSQEGVFPAEGSGTPSIEKE
jgi:hypothetical protein